MVTGWIANVLASVMCGAGIVYKEYLFNVRAFDVIKKSTLDTFVAFGVSAAVAIYVEGMEEFSSGRFMDNIEWVGTTGLLVAVARRDESRGSCLKRQFFLRVDS